jgi:hypothetical protein
MRRGEFMQTITMGKKEKKHTSESDGRNGRTGRWLGNRIILQLREKGAPLWRRKKASVGKNQN